MPEVFLDSSYAIALASATDAHHRKALDLADHLKEQQARLITTRPVVLEIGNALSRLRYREAAVVLLTSIEQDAQIEVIPASEGLCQRAFELFKNRPDKEWGLTDCLSFVVMDDRDLRDALTADHHFRQDGFHPLLLE